MCSVVDAQNKVREIRSGGIQIIKGEDTPPAPKPVRVVFWTNQKTQGSIRIYVNNRYVGKITRSYSSAPSCGAAGCVTVTLSGKGNSWYGKAEDGTIWTSSLTSLVAGCNRIRLYSTGSPQRVSSDRSGSRAHVAETPMHRENEPTFEQQLVGNMLDNIDAERIGKSMGNQLSHISAVKGWNSYTNRIDLALGYGLSFGGLGARLSYQAPAVFGISVGAGYNMSYDPNVGNVKKILWNAGIQMWLTDHFNLAMHVGPRYFKKLKMTEAGLSLMVNYQHSIYRRLGVMAGLGYSLSLEEPEKNVKSAFEWNVGLVFRLFED